jgi:hypothetical protein
MNIGSGKFLEMFRERFGEAAHTAMLVFIALCYFGVGSTIIYHTLLKPIYSTILDVSGNSGLLSLLHNESIAAVCSVVVAYVLTVLVWNVSLLRFRNNLRTGKLDSDIELAIRKYLEAKE